MPPSEIRQSVGESENVKLHNAIPARKIESTNFHLKVTSIFSKVACLSVLKNQASMKCMHDSRIYSTRRWWWALWRCWSGRGGVGARRRWTFGLQALSCGGTRLEVNRRPCEEKIYM